MQQETVTARTLVLDAERRFSAAGLVFGHGTDNARDEAVFLVFHALGLPFDVSDDALDAPLDDDRCARVAALVDARIETRRPAAYLTGRMWFAGLEFCVDDSVLVPRSPIAELIAQQFAPWLDAKSIRHVLEIGTGSGCIAIALASCLPHARVVATDISTAALATARRNAAMHAHATRRIEWVEADLFPAHGGPFDLIVSNPPYVPVATVDELPPEYHHEPRIALAAGQDGLDCVRRICAAAPRFLARDGALLLDVGEMAAVVDREILDVQFTWVELVHGGEGIGIALASDFHTHD